MRSRHTLRPFLIAVALATVQPDIGVGQEAIRDGGEQTMRSRALATAIRSTSTTAITVSPAGIQPVSVNVDSLRQILRRYAERRHPRRRIRDISGLMTLLDVASARTENQWRAHVRRLPVTIRESRGWDNAGRPGTLKVFTHRSGRTVTHFFPDGNAAPLMTAGLTFEDREQRPRGPMLVSSHNGFAAKTDDECEYYDDDEEYLYTGDCVTEQDVEDYTILALAMEEEVAAMDVEVQEAASFIEWCESFDDGDPETIQDAPEECPTGEGQPANIHLYDTPEHLIDNFQPISGEAYFEGVIACTSAAAAEVPCSAYAVGVTASYIRWAFDFGKFGRALFVRSVATVVASTYGAALASSLAVISTGAIYIHCAYFRD